MLTDAPASSTQSPGPSQSLSPRDERLLNSYLNRDLNLFAVARDEAEDPLALMKWAARPEIKELMTEMRAHRKVALESLQQTARMVAIQTLKDTASDGPDPVERRRAASTLMRGFGVPAPTRGRSVLHPPPPGEVPRSSAAEGAPSLRSSTPSTSSAPASPSAPSSLAPPPPPPRPPSSTYAATITKVLLHSGTTRNALQDLHRYMMPSATICGRPAPRHIIHFMDSLSTGPLADFIKSTPPDTKPSLLTSDDTADTYHLGSLSLRLVYFNKHWLIDAIDTT